MIALKYKQIKTKKIYEEVADALLEKIKAGELKPGEKLDSVQALSESFQVSRSAVREALSALKAMGLVDMKQGEGTYIREFEPSHVSQPLSSALLMKKEDVKQPPKSESRLNSASPPWPLKNAPKTIYKKSARLSWR